MGKASLRQSIGEIACVFLLLLCAAAGTARAQEKVLHSFYKTHKDGASPMTGVIEVDGTLYGTTLEGGGNGCIEVGCGTVFALNTHTGVEKVLHSFGNGYGGLGPQGGLIDVKGTLYGTTLNSSYCNLCGTVFAIKRATGAAKVLYRFCSQSNCADGSGPEGSLIDVQGTLYGTTIGGGSSQAGSVFSVNPDTGAEKVLYSFCSRLNCTDGVYPNGNLIYAKGALYGTTYEGGGGCSCGTVFAFDLSTSAETTLHQFGQGADGTFPRPGLVALAGTLYGTTQSGGGTACGGSGCGTVFAVDLQSGAERLIYAFCAQQNCTDGNDPGGGLIVKDGTLYGTTGLGGPHASGEVFALDPNTGTEKTLYGFQNSPDGQGPSGYLIEVGGTFYGTTAFGGLYRRGTVFALTP